MHCLRTGLAGLGYGVISVDTASNTQDGDPDLQTPDNIYTGDQSYEMGDDLRVKIQCQFNRLLNKIWKRLLTLMEL